MLHLSVEHFVALLLLGAVILAVWTFLRFGRLGPRSLQGVVVHFLVAWMLVSAMPDLADGVVAARLPAAGLVISFGLLLPVFTYLFLTSAWCARLLVSLLSGLR